MGQAMTLLEIVQNLENLDEEGTIYAKQPWTAGSSAVVAREPDGGGLPTEAERQNLDYFLEVSIAREFLEDWTNNRPSSPTSQEKCERIIRYAIDDA